MAVVSISSAQNDYFRRWKELSTSRGLRKQGEFILMGEKLIREFLKKPGFKIKAEILREGLSALSPAKAFQLSPALFDELDVMGTHFNLLVLELPEFAKFASRPPQGLEMICPLGDPSNMGALIRSARAFGVSKIILTSEAAHPFLPKSLKASAGAALEMPFEKAGPLTDLLPELDPLWALDMNGQSLDDVRWPANLYLLVGEEGPGLPHGKIGNRIRIPTEGVESLNATVASSLAMYSYAQQARKVKI